MKKLKQQPKFQSHPQSNDHFQKPLTNEQKLASLAHHIDQLYTALGDVNSRLIAVCRAKLGAKELASFMRESEQNSLYMKNLNASLEYEAAQEAKKTAALPTNLPPEVYATPDDEPSEPTSA